MAKTNTELVAYCEKALAEKWRYGWGAYGQKATSALLESLVKQYPSMNTKWKSYMMEAVSAGTRLSDCYGLVKGYLSQEADGSIKLKEKFDINTAMAYSRAAAKGPLSNLPEVPGVILYMKGHVGVYCGGGRFIECAGGGAGMCAGKISGGKITSGSKFTHWFKDVNITYETPKPAVPKPVNLAAPVTPDAPIVPAASAVNVRELAMIIGDKECMVKTILYEDSNYVSLRGIASLLGYAVEFDPFEKVPVLYPVELDAEEEEDA
jgi:hypothetical protein